MDIIIYSEDKRQIQKSMKAHWNVRSIWPKSSIFKRRQKIVSDGDDVTRCGKLFHIRAAQQERRGNQGRSDRLMLWIWHKGSWIQLVWHAFTSTDLNQGENRYPWHIWRVEWYPSLWSTSRLESGCVDEPNRYSVLNVLSCSRLDLIHDL